MSRKVQREDSYMLFLINPLFLISFWQQKQEEQHTAPRTEVIGWDMHKSPSVNILLTTKLLSLSPLSWDMDCLLTLWPLLIPCSLGNSCCTFDFLIFITVERNSLYNNLYIFTERSLKHLWSIRAWVPVSVFLSLSLPPPPANSLKRRNPPSSCSCPGFQDLLEKAPCAFMSGTSPVVGSYWFSALTREYQLLSLFHFLIIDCGPPGSGPLKDCNIHYRIVFQVTVWREQYLMIDNEIICYYYGKK